MHPDAARYMRSTHTRYAHSPTLLPSEIQTLMVAHGHPHAAVFGAARGFFDRLPYAAHASGRWLFYQGPLNFGIAFTPDLRLGGTPSSLLTSSSVRTAAEKGWHEALPDDYMIGPWVIRTTDRPFRQALVQALRPYAMEWTCISGAWQCTFEPHSMQRNARLWWALCELRRPYIADEVERRIFGLASMADLLCPLLAAFAHRGDCWI